MKKKKSFALQLNKSKLKDKLSIFSIFVLVVLVLYCLLLLAILLWGFISSFKDPRFDFRINPIGFPKKWILDNYDYAYSKFVMHAYDNNGAESIVGMPAMFIYGFLYAIGCAFAATIVPCLTGYVTAKFNFKFSKVIFYTVIVAMIVPIVGSLPAEIAMAKSLNLYNQIWGMWILKANFLGLYFIVFYNFFKNLPNAYNEAAKIDGSSNFRTMVQVILPLAAPLFATVLLINFITFWNDYQVPLIYLPGYPTIAAGMQHMTSSDAGELQYIPVKVAAATLMLTPILIIFLFTHKKLLGNLTMGGIKG